MTFTEPPWRPLTLTLPLSLTLTLRPLGPWYLTLPANQSTAEKPISALSPSTARNFNVRCASDFLLFELHHQWLALSGKAALMGSRRQGSTLSAQVVIHSVAGEAMKPGSQCRSGASVGVLGRQSISREERCRTQKTANSRTNHDRSNSGRADNNTSEAVH